MLPAPANSPDARPATEAVGDPLILSRSSHARIELSDAAAAAPAIAVFVSLVLYRILLDPTWVGDLSDEGGYFLMSRNVWRYGLPVLNESGSQYWSHSFSPAVSVLLAPLGALPMAAAVLLERLAVMLSGVAFLSFAYDWMRRDVQLDRFWAALVLMCTAVSYSLVEDAAA